VFGSNIVQVANASPTSITNFAGGETNQMIVLVFSDANTTIVHGTNIRLNAGTNFAASANSTLTLVKTSGPWVEISRSINA
jgi:uncharacterized protein (DUF2345 family)